MRTFFHDPRLVTPVRLVKNPKRVVVAKQGRNYWKEK